MQNNPPKLDFSEIFEFFKMMSDKSKFLIHAGDSSLKPVADCDYMNDTRFYTS